MGDHTRDALTYSIIGAAMNVHSELGSGFLEAVYQGALAIGMRWRGIVYEREVRIPVEYCGEPTGGIYRADFVCDDRVLVELKAQRELCAVDVGQVVHYLKGTGMTVGLLRNFGSPVLEYKRVIHTDDWHARQQSLAVSVESVESAGPSVESV